MTVPSLPPMASGGIPALGHAVQFLRDPIPLIERGYNEHGTIFSPPLARW